MTTLTQPAAQPSSESARRRVTQAKVVRSEWTKFRTQPSTAWSLLAAVAPATFATFLVSQSVLSREQLGTSLHQPGVARAVLGSALYLTAVGLLGLGLGALLRNTAGAIASLFGVLFGLQIVVGFLPASVADKVSRYLPTPAGVAITNVRPDPASLPPWTGFGMFCLYTVILLGLAAWLLRRRDV
jgi:ABC-2 type transport system permease protein